MTASDEADPVGTTVPEPDVPVCRSSMGDGDGEDLLAGSVGGQLGVAIQRGVAVGGLTVSYEVRYVGGADGERFAAAQAKAIAALLKWHAGCAEVGRS
ncbi:hypothetical protein [Nocardia australiensis]|uniref:hypothetical protein n=1 Tax=Nocardia australiensis TaxID=2887191 RepID=UPI001D14786A|nr:hypothetical protein [Nocardia australiensis]